MNTKKLDEILSFLIEENRLGNIYKKESFYSPIKNLVEEFQLSESAIKLDAFMYQANNVLNFSNTHLRCFMKPDEKSKFAYHLVYENLLTEDVIHDDLFLLGNQKLKDSDCFEFYCFWILSDEDEVDDVYKPAKRIPIITPPLPVDPDSTDFKLKF